MGGKLKMWHRQQVKHQFGSRPPVAVLRRMQAVELAMHTDMIESIMQPILNSGYQSTCPTCLGVRECVSSSTLTSGRAAMSSRCQACSSQPRVLASARISATALSRCCPCKSE